MTYNSTTKQLSGTWTSERKIIYAGGWFTKASIADDDTLVCGSDVGGPWILQPGEDVWANLLRAGDNYDLGPLPYLETGCLDVAICATNSAVTYFFVGGWLFKTTDGGATVTKTAMPQITAWGANDAFRMVGKLLAVDPINADHVIVGTPSGLKRSTDGGATWTTISTGTVPIPVNVYLLQYSGRTASIALGQTVTGATSGATGVLIADHADEGVNTLPYGSLYLRGLTGNFVQGENIQVGGVTKAVASAQQKLLGASRPCVAFDRSSAASGGRTSVVRVFILGSGLHSSTDTGATWGAAAAGTSAFYPAHMAISESTGRIHLSGWCAGVEAPGVVSQYRYSDNATSWTAPSGIVGKVTAISPHTAGHMYLITAGGGYRFSPDDGTTWGSLALSAFGDTPAEWVATTDANNFKSNGTALFARTTNRIWLFEGVSPWRTDDPPTDSTLITWAGVPRGAENMILGLMAIFPDGLRGHAIHDRCGMIIEPGDIGQRSPKRAALTGIFCHGGSVAQPPGSPDFLTMCNFWSDDRYDGQLRRGGWSSDRGLTWTPFASNIAVTLGGSGGGNIVSLSESVHIQRQTSNGKTGWTKDNGATWQELIIGNGNATRGHGVYYANHRVLVADKYVANQAYLYMCDDNVWGDATAPTEADLIDCRGIWRINYDPETEEMTVTNVRPTWIINNTDFNHGQLVQFGPDDWLWSAQDGSSGVYRSQDGGTTWAQMTFSGDGFTNANFGVAFTTSVGKPVAEGDPNTLLIFGWRDPARPSDGDYSSYGAWLCMDVDNGNNLHRIEQFPGNTHQNQVNAAGDPSVFGSFDLGGSEGALNLRFRDVRRGR